MTPTPVTPTPMTPTPVNRRSLTARIAHWLLAHPRPGLRLLGQREPLWRDGRRLHPGLQLLLATGARRAATTADTDWAKARKEMRTMVRLSSPVRAGVLATDRHLPGDDGPIPVRVYRPASAVGPVPAVVYLHGGGFCVGDLDTHDPSCRVLAERSGCVVVSVDYRLAPEHVFPAAVDDCVAAYRWVLDHPEDLGIEPGAVGVMGDSAGATLSAVVCLEARRLGLTQPRMQCLVYPLADVGMRTPSYEIFSEGFGLTAEGVGVFRDTYVPSPELWDDPRVSPIFAGEFGGLAPALVITAGFDVLRDDGRAYADALAAAGVPTTYRCYDDMIHGFHAMLVLDDAAAAADAIATEVGALMRTPPSAP